MSLISLPFTFTVGAVIIASQHNSNFSTIYNDYNGNIQDVNIASNAAIEYSKLSLNNSILSSDIKTSTIFAIGNIPTLSYLNITQFPYIKISNTQAQNTSGGTATSGAWRLIPFNTKDSDTGNIATLSGNQISLPAGTYLCKVHCPFRRTVMTQTRLFNSTDSSVLINGSCVSISNTDDTGGISVILGQFTLSSTKTIEIDYQVSTTTNTDGLGSACNFTTEVYAIAEFTKIG